MRTKQKIDMLSQEVFNLPDEKEIKAVDMSQPIKVLFDDFITFISRTDFE